MYELLVKGSNGVKLKMFICRDHKVNFHRQKNQFEFSSSNFIKIQEPYNTDP